MVLSAARRHVRPHATRRDDRTQSINIWKGKAVCMCVCCPATARLQPYPLTLTLSSASSARPSASSTRCSNSESWNWTKTLISMKILNSLLEKILLGNWGWKTGIVRVYRKKKGMGWVECGYPPREGDSGTEFQIKELLSAVKLFKLLKKSMVAIVGFKNKIWDINVVILSKSVL